MKDKKKEIILYSIGALFLVPGILFKYVFKDLDISVIIEYISFSIAYIFIAHDVFFDMVEEFKEKNIFNESLLMITASIAAIIIREEIEAIILIVLSIIGEILEDLAHDKTEKNIAKAMNIKVDQVALKDGTVIPVAQAKIGDIIIVKVGELIPLDGIIIEGNSTLDTKRITGEPMPLDVSAGDNILSGSLNLTEILYIKVLKEYENSLSKRLYDLVSEAKERKSKAENFIDKFAKIYTPTVIFIAIALFFIEYYAIGLTINQSLIYSATVLVAACPCAIIIGVPLSFYSGLGRASKEGILIRGSEYIESIKNMGSIVFDKTGTLTLGEFEVVDAIFYDIEKEEALSLIKTLESYSTHPIARCLIEEFKLYKNIDNLKEIKETGGIGLSAIYGEKRITIGGLNALKEAGISLGESYDNTNVFLIIDNELKTVLKLKDKLRNESKKSINFFKRYSIKTYMLTGDNKAKAEELSKELEIDEYEGGLLPEDKINYLTKYLDSKGKKSLAYVGDGINDAPALKLSDIGIAMGLESSEAAKEAADIVILRDDISKVKDLYLISKFTHKIAILNIIIALSIKALVILFVSLNLLSFLGSYIFIVGLLSDTGLSLLCILISRLISSYKIKE